MHNESVCCRYRCMHDMHTPLCLHTGYKIGKCMSEELVVDSMWSKAGVIGKGTIHKTAKFKLQPVHSSSIKLVFGRCGCL